MFVTSPFTQPAVVAAALGFSKGDCVQAAPPEGGDGGGSPQLLGKMPLRLAFPEVAVRWRRKDPVEVSAAGARKQHTWAPHVVRQLHRCRVSRLLTSPGWVRHHRAQRPPLAARAQHGLLQPAHEVGCVCSSRSAGAEPASLV